MSTTATESAFKTVKGRLWYRASDLLEGDCRPIVGRRNPLWKVAGLPEHLLHDGAFLPVWTWTHPRKYAAGTEVIDLDVSAAYVAAASSAAFAHGGHVRTGAGTPVKPRPGAYLIDAHPWQVDAIVSPLGSANLTPRVWVAEPTLTLLLELTEQGYWPGVDVYDSYQAETSCRLRKWTDRIKLDRSAVLDDLRFDPQDPDALERYDAVKDGYAVAIQMLATPHGPEKKNKYYRPDWYETIHAAHAANTWRKAWKGGMLGHFPVAMGDTDELTYTPQDLAEIMNVVKPPFTVDESGHQLGSLKTKREPYVLETLPAPRPAMDDDDLDLEDDE